MKSSLLHESAVHEVKPWFGSVWFGLVWFGLVYLFIHSVTYVTQDTSITDYNLQLLLLPLALQPTVGFGPSNNILPFFPIYHQHSPSSHSQHLKISFYFLFPSFPGSSLSSRPLQFLGEDLFGHPILLHSLQVT